MLFVDLFKHVRDIMELSWNNHIQNVTTKANKTLGYLKDLSYNFIYVEIYAPNIKAYVKQHIKLLLGLK